MKTNNEQEDHQNDPSKWFFGIFYFNRQDKRLILPKRIPFLGWTFNFANPALAIVMVALIVLIIALNFAQHI